MTTVDRFCISVADIEAIAKLPIPVHFDDFRREALRKMYAAIEERIECFRECGVELHRMWLATDPLGGTYLVVDGISRFHWVIDYGH